MPNKVNEFLMHMRNSDKYYAECSPEVKDDKVYKYVNEIKERKTNKNVIVVEFYVDQDCFVIRCNNGLMMYSEDAEQSACLAKVWIDE